MSTEIKHRIEQISRYVATQRELIIGINEAIENYSFVPSKAQEITINYICQQGRNGLREIERLKQLLKSYEQ